VLYGAFASFSADGWGPIPTQPAQRLYGRLVWAPDGSQLVFSSLDGASANAYAIGADGRTQPRLLLEAAEALDWLP
jgi:Tol biopolymer transport system component